jgi:putative GTP pyrophosphokinase
MDTKLNNMSLNNDLDIERQQIATAILSNRQRIDAMMSRYKCAVMEVETKFKVLNEQFSLEYDRNPIEAIKSRVKSIDSIIEKIQRKNIKPTLESVEENISDIAGVRVICSFREDIYYLAKCFLNQDDIRLVEIKDYIKKPKEGGYRSLHLIVQVPIFLQNEKRNVKVEVQLRTIAMDFWASLEHKLRYKKEINPADAEELAKDLKDCAETSMLLDIRMEEIKNRINKSKVK